eukprot:TRINITY_DN6375_c0_g2_i1.p1 TRINITY_DN6375_c0_g2~~TRINITY_DN6375_c0_g2_i1.p1  ORF type:complete len:191 (-),score=42.67 TRINITY_DN6375_c0_g2_i1:274-846(-)
MAFTFDKNTSGSNLTLSNNYSTISIDTNYSRKESSIIGCSSFKLNTEYSWKFEFSNCEFVSFGIIRKTDLNQQDSHCRYHSYGWSSWGKVYSDKSTSDELPDKKEFTFKTATVYLKFKNTCLQYILEINNVKKTLKKLKDIPIDEFFPYLYVEQKGQVQLTSDFLFPINNLLQNNNNNEKPPTLPPRDYN